MVIVEENIALHLRGAVVALGVFDGVHIGHKVIIERTVAEAKLKGVKSVVVTFRNHPRNILCNSHSPIYMLTTFKERCQLIENLGIDYLYIINFTSEFGKISAPLFLRQVVIDKIGASTIVIGRHHSFGADGYGNNSNVDTIAGQLGLSVIHIAGQYKGNIDIASSCIRELIRAGEIEKANLLLGRTYSLSGTVVKGKGLGKKWGYPTANIQLLNSEKIIPKEGVYAVLIDCGSQKHHNVQYKGMMSIGKNPTIGETKECLLEVNIFDFERDIYGEELTIYFLYYMRNIHTFPSTKELLEQLAKDKQDAINRFNQ